MCGSFRRILPAAVAMWFPLIGVADEAQLQFFEKRIRPVLVEHCYKCHASEARNVRGGFLLDSREALLAGGDSGPAVVPGKPEDSLLLESLRHESFEMPPDQRLPDNVIADFETWIRNGAHDPRTGGQKLERKAIDLQAGRQFWSFRDLAVPEIPQHDSSWARSDIDRYLESTYRSHNVQPSPDASADVTARRLYFDLTGLPPTPDQLNAFRADWQTNPDEAIAGLAEQLLQSQRFGQRWGRHWLDVTRFAESSGGGRSLMFPHAWRFRDYVIRSFNDDKPIDRLIQEHIAGDLLPWTSAEQHDDQLVAAGYLALGPTNYELQDKELLRMEVIDEQIDTLGRTFLGLTLGCARCHDHKFDPVPTADYYGLVGIFRSTKSLVPGNVSGYVTTSLKTGYDPSALKAWQQQDAEIKDQLNALKKQLKQHATSAEAGINPASLPGIVVDDQQAVFEGMWTDSTSLPPYIGRGYRHDGNQRKGQKVRFETSLPTSGQYLVRFAHNYSASRTPSLPIHIHHAEGESVVTIDQRISTGTDGVFSDLGTFSFTAEQSAKVIINVDEAAAGHVIIDAVQFLPVLDSADESLADAKREVMRQAQIQSQVAELEKQLKQHATAKPDIPVAMCVTDQDQPADWHLHVRGGVRNLGPIVSRGFVSVLSPAADDAGNAAPPQIPDGASGRLELARWVASEQNPLTARVFVNRVWQHLIGEGLVRTPDNFGATGRLPTHPELLDYLAHSFVHEDQWSVKKLIQRIVTSRVYRLSSEVDTATGGTDPDNLLLTHAFRRCLEAEAIRDSILQISGQLDTSVTGGRTINRITQYDNGYDHTQHSASLPSVYVPFFRNSMLETFEVFDIANPNLVTGRRTTSTLPSQALYLLNSPFILEQSRLAADNFLSTQSGDSGTSELMVTQAWQITLGRQPSGEELETVLQFLQSEPDSPDNSVGRWTSVFQALFASMDFRYLD